jgi:CDP-glycerol glycerophosphotransferase (TagB/SpsB family)
MAVLKKTGKVAFLGYPDFDDMLRGILPYINNELIVLTHDSHSARPEWLPPNIKVVQKTSVIGLYHILTSEVIYFTHGISKFFIPIKKNRQCIINLWHGMPLKKIGYLDGKKQVSESHYIIATSYFFQSILAQSFGMSNEDIIVTGLPRNDILTSKTSNSELIDVECGFNKVFVWLPTYRASNVGDVRVDGKNLPLLGFENFDIERLNGILQSINAVLYVKPHPMSPHSDDDYKMLSNVNIINDSWLSDKSITLYELLSISDELWTDFSSVYVDYLLTGKEIKFVINDLAEYSNSRGFTFDIVSLGFPGELIQSQEELFMSITQCSDVTKKYDKGMYHSVSRFDYELLEGVRN